MKFIKNIQEKYLRYFDIILYITIFTVFIASLRLYIPIFALNIIIVVTLILTGDIKLKFSKWQIAVITFMLWSIISSIFAILIFKHTVDINTLVKLNLNMMFLLTTSLVIEQKSIEFNKKKFMNFLEFIIIINFIQILLIYVFGGLVNEFINGSLTQKSDTAYVISAFYNVIGAESKNIWAGKFLLFYTVYLYVITFDEFIISKVRKYIHIIIGILTLLLLLSRTAQIAVIIPIIFIGFYSIRNIQYKYKVAVYFAFAIGIVIVMTIFFNKFFHIKFDMTDGGYTRLYIWQKFFENVYNTNFVIGNGIGYSKQFIETVINRTESNLHNVYFNIFFEMGIIGVTSYITFLIAFAKEVMTKNKIITTLFIVVVPFVITTFLQYLGFDNDIIMVFILLLILKQKNPVEILS
ncbi:O-antigen ligase family protein [Clostridium gasigenes]|uniref:O-antigen ligase family protein n=1 Tax=Clostridium gasigenes TaxID=94869 RepID=A0A7X0SDC1_9CLOT|nr:O-antigen ligase family protein [Clostridium gasigenes]MBB6713501.1 O-antigen ligase family protein [Clostridium gasigenes]